MLFCCEDVRKVEFASEFLLIAKLKVFERLN
jgi:hypothetical protein